MKGDFYNVEVLQVLVETRRALRKVGSLSPLIARDLFILPMLRNIGEGVDAEFLRLIELTYNIKCNESDVTVMRRGPWKVVTKRVAFSGIDFMLYNSIMGKDLSRAISLSRQPYHNTGLRRNVDELLSMVEAFCVGTNPFVGSITMPGLFAEAMSMVEDQEWFLYNVSLIIGNIIDNMIDSSHTWNA